MFCGDFYWTWEWDIDGATVCDIDLYVTVECDDQFDTPSISEIGFIGKDKDGEDLIVGLPDFLEKRVYDDLNACSKFQDRAYEALEEDGCNFASDDPGMPIVL